MICRRCGKDVEGQHHCPMCGASFKTQVVRRDIIPTETKKKRSVSGIMPQFIALAVAILLIGGILFFLWR